ncbi:sodium-dependent multivitamin transporter-like [Ptychodera flava]|uniref:sodium-dependent multivitamin transporter-like n=1 Tax=Ptychodera flava TaxID=63121 RepID=UPI00396A12FC
MEEAVGFTVVDYVVFGIVLLLSILIGLYYGCFGKKQKTTEEYLLADRKMNYIPVAFSLMASFISAITILGMPSEIFTYGWMYWMTCFTYFITVPVAAHLFLPVLYNLKITSIYEYIEMRFNLAARLLCTSLYIFYKTFYLSIAVYAPSLALSAVSGLHVWISVATVGIICTFYTAVGGMKAVIWTDVLQSLIMFSGLLAVIIQGCIDLGGGDVAWQIAKDSGRIYFADWSLDPTVRHTIWSIFIGYSFGVFPTFGVSQATAQRFFSCRSVRDGQKSIYVSIPIVITIISLACFCGIVMYATYVDCDPLASGKVAVPDQRMAYFVLDKFTHVPGFGGLFISATFSGALSTLSSGLNSLAAVTFQDFIKPFSCGVKLSDSKTTLVLKILCSAYGVIAILLVLLVSNMGLVLQLALSIGSLVLAPVLGMFILGLFFPWTNSAGAITGTVSGISIALVITVGKFFYPPSWPKFPTSIDGCTNVTSNLTYLTSTFAPEVTMTSLMTPTVTMTSLTSAEEGFAWFLNMSYLWYSPVELTVTIVIGLLVSFLVGRTDPLSVDRRLLSPLVDSLCSCCLPDDWKERGKVEVDGKGDGWKYREKAEMNGPDGQLTNVYGVEMIAKSTQTRDEDGK